VDALVRRVADDVWSGGEQDESKEEALAALKELASGKQVTEALEKASRSKTAAVRAWATARLAAQLVPGVK
jgi:hypothetical protein